MDITIQVHIDDATIEKALERTNNAEFNHRLEEMLGSINTKVTADVNKGLLQAALATMKKHGMRLPSQEEVNEMLAETPEP